VPWSWASLDRCEARGLTNHGNYGDTPAVLTVVLESYLPIELGVQRVVLPQPDIEAGFESPPLLSHQNRPAGDDVSIVALDAKALRVAVAAVT
jgi:hypothetical protein